MRNKLFNATGGPISTFEGKSDTYFLSEWSRYERYNEFAINYLTSA